MKEQWSKLKIHEYNFEQLMYVGEGNVITTFDSYYENEPPPFSIYRDRSHKEASVLH